MEWHKGSIAYQCFVDSFARSGKDNDDNLLEWGQRDKNYHLGNSYYGGDLRGIISNIPYLKQLGITLLYLTPIFHAKSNHKYDTIDYFKIDPCFGSMEDFDALVNLCDVNGIRIVLDGVFNHSGIGAFEQNFYKYTKTGYLKYWRGVKSLPVLDHTNQYVRDYFYEKKDSVVDFWLKKGVSGWRLDSCAELGKRAVSKIYKNIKERYPNTCIIGEVIGFGDDWLAKERLDGVTNYVFKALVTKFLKNKIDGIDFLHELTKMYEKYPFEKLINSWNILNSHDTNRFFYDLKQDEALFRLGVVLQFTYPGVPMIYYGDDAGMHGGRRNVDNRVGMDWNLLKEPNNNERYMFYREMIRFRKSYNLFVNGEFLPVSADKNKIVFKRKHEHQSIDIIIDRSSKKFFLSPFVV